MSVDYAEIGRPIYPSHDLVDANHLRARCIIHILTDREMGHLSSPFEGLEAYQRSAE